MNILAVDDEALALEMLTDAIREAMPDAHLHAFTKPAQALDYLRDNQADIAFLDISMRGMTGMELAAALRKLQPRLNIIFATGYSDYTGEAMAMHASGYLMKPVTAEKIRREISDLRYPVQQESKALLKVRCFGNFDLYDMNGNPLHFDRSKAKEVFAFLVYRSGTSCTVREIAAAIFEDREYDKRLLDYMQKLVASMVQALKGAGAEEVLTKRYNSLSIDPELLDCDYYRFLNREPQAMQLYTGAFMQCYPWAADVQTRLDERIKAETI